MCPLRPKSHQQLTECKAYPHDFTLCLVPLIKLYLDKSAVLRHDVNSMFSLAMLPHTSQCHQEHWQGGYQIKLIHSIQHRHQMRSMVAFPLPKLQRQLDGQM